MIRTEALRVFVTVASCGNLRDAADRLFRTQSAISMTLKQLEDHLGAPLFESDRKHSLTDLGRFVQGVAGVLLRDLDTAIGLIEEYASGHSGKLRLASVPSVAALLIPEMLASFLTERPLAKIDLVDRDSADVRRLVATGQADLGIASADPTETGLHMTPIFEDRMLLVCRADSALAAHPGPLDWEALTTVPMILNETTRAIQATEFQAIAAEARIRVRNVTSLLAMVRAGVGVTLLPGLATFGLPPSLVARPLGDITWRRQVCLLRREGRVQSPLARAFQAHLVGTIRSLTDRFGILPVEDATGPTASLAGQIPIAPPNRAPHLDVSAGTGPNPAANGRPSRNG
jgi:DNA-binding transcriptional LysR family regulator